MRIAVITLLFCVSLGANALGQDAPPPIVGVGTAIDTDVIAVGGERIFLFGIEAFEKEQMCFLNGRPWACGAVAFRELQIILAEGEISCVRRKDSNRRRFRKPWATCHLNGADIAEQLAACLRVADTVARWGGEEFIVLAPATDIDQGREIGEKLRKAIEAMSQVHGKTTTISVGVAAYIEGETFNSWCDRADDALYKAKESGRNQVVISDIKYSVIPQEQGIERQVDAGIYAADQTVKDDGSGEI